MNAIAVHDAFTPQGSAAAPAPAVSAGSGCIWLHLYQAVTGGAGRYVQGGGCTTVGVPGLLLGGGSAASRSVTASPPRACSKPRSSPRTVQTRTVNAAREPDLFWALKGGGRRNVRRRHPR